MTNGSGSSNAPIVNKFFDFHIDANGERKAKCKKCERILRGEHKLGISHLVRHARMQHEEDYMREKNELGG